jgi:hypothetical protein
MDSASKLSGVSAAAFPAPKRAVSALAAIKIARVVMKPSLAQP